MRGTGDEVGTGAEIAVAPVSAADAEVGALLGALTAELAGGGYTPEQTFGYSVAQLERSGVRLVGVRADGVLVGVGGIELQDDGVAELKRFYVPPDWRGRGVVDAVMAGVLGIAREAGVRRVRLETGDGQVAAMRMYRAARFRRGRALRPVYRQ